MLDQGLLFAEVARRLGCSKEYIRQIPAFAGNGAGEASGITVSAMSHAAEYNPGLGNPMGDLARILQNLGVCWRPCLNSLGHPMAWRISIRGVVCAVVTANAPRSEDTYRAGVTGALTSLLRKPLPWDFCMTLTGSGLLYVFPRVLFSGRRSRTRIAIARERGLPTSRTDYERYRNLLI